MRVSHVMAEVTLPDVVSETASLVDLGPRDDREGLQCIETDVAVPCQSGGDADAGVHRPRELLGKTDLDYFTHFTVDVLREGASQFGLMLLKFDTFMEVVGVNEHSPMQGWNARSAVVFPSDQVMKGDQIVLVNFEKDVHRFEAVFAEADRLFMVVRRPWWCHVAGRAKRGLA